MLGTTELLVILGLAILFFGARKIPDLASALGKGIRNFKKALKEPDAIDVTEGRPPQVPDQNGAKQETEKK
ncbi:MAG: twin-arginine translocase TatA/TatE family subunit, partial [Bdellovibrionota bacterium]